MGGQGIYRVLLIVPYGLPALLMTLVWKGMLNTDFGVINSVLGAKIPWLTDPWLATVLGPRRQPVAGLPVLLPGLLGGADARSRPTARRPPTSTARPGGTPSAPWSCRCCSSPPRRCW